MKSGHEHAAGGRPRGEKWRSGERFAPVIRYDRLMEASEERLDAAMHSGIPAEELIATRIFDNPKDFGRWESQHAGLMRRIVVAPSAAAQKCELLTAALALIHRKALFEFLQTHQVRGSERIRLFQHFHGSIDYRAAVISEHGTFLRSAASYLCSSHVGTHLMLDDIFDQPLLDYEQLYAEYFGLFCHATMAAPGDAKAASLLPLLAPLKRQVSEWRNSLLALAHSHSGIWRAPVIRC